MRTAIFVYETSELSIDTSEDGLHLEVLEGGVVELKRANSLPLVRGVYRVHSQRPIRVSTLGQVATELDIVTGELKDEVPEPRPKIVNETDTRSAKYQNFKKRFKAFFPVARPAND